MQIPPFWIYFMQTSNLYSSPFNPNPNDPSIHPTLHSTSTLRRPKSTSFGSLEILSNIPHPHINIVIVVRVPPPPPGHGGIYHCSNCWTNTRARVLCLRPPTTKYGRGDGSSVNNLSKSAVNTRTYDTLATYDIYEDHRLLESRASQSGGLWQNGHINGSSGREIEL